MITENKGFGIGRSRVYKNVKNIIEKGYKKQTQKMRIYDNISSILVQKKVMKEMNLVMEK